MNKRRAFLFVLLACVLSLVCVFAACNKKNDGDANVAVEEVTLSESVINLKMGEKETATLVATISPANATNKEVIWVSSDTSVVTVADGVVTAVAQGTATVSVTTVDGGKKAECEVVVSAASANPPATVAVTGVSLNVSSVTLQMGATTTANLVATISPANATNKSVTWTSSDSSVVTVSNGNITAIKAGTATVMVTTQDGGYSSSCDVTVNAAVAGTVSVTGVSLDKTTATLQVGNSVTLVATVAPVGATNKTVTWTSSDNTVATVNNGVVTALKAGTATITVTTQDGGKTATCAVTVEAAQVNPPVDPDPDTPINPPAGDYTADGTYVLDIENAGATASIYTWTKGSADGAFSTNDANEKFFKLSSKSGAYDYLYINMNLKAGTTITINGNARPTSTAAGKSVVLGVVLKSDSTGTVSGITATQTFSGSAAAINQVITVTKTGTVVLQLSRSSGNTGCEITEFSVKIGAPEPVAVESVSLNKTESALKVGATETLTATVSPENADVKTVTWTSSDDTVVTVVNGVVTARKAGTATVTATADGGKTATCEYTVTNVAVESVSLNKASHTLAAGKTFNLVATISPANATIKTVTYSSSNQAVATVDANGKVTAVAAGEAVITVTADGGKTATFTLTVVANDVPVTGITLNETSVAKYVGDTLQLTATVTPADALDKSVEWTTSNATIATVSANGLVTIVGEGTVTITVTSNNDSTKSATCVITATYQTFEVTFKNGDTVVYTAPVRKGELAQRYNSLTQEGYSLTGWYTNQACTGEAFDFSTPITEDITLWAKWQKSEIKITYQQGNYESAAIEWTEKNASAAKVYYKLESALDGAYTLVDSQLIRQADSDTARVDVLGLKGGETYSFKVVSSSLGESIVNLDIKKYDRSGYAHFNYTSGVGAYNDDGTLKDNAIVIYVTDETKNTVTLTYGDITISGIGNILNSVGKACGEAGHENECKKVSGGKTYYGTANTNQGILEKLAKDNIPLVVRFIGTVSDSGLYKTATFSAASKSLINGLTEYDSNNYGGSEGDNGHMARMKSGKDVTLEGVGEDATIDGWGFHYMAESANPTLGKSFEVRNLIFINTPEDALGMEGVQEGSDLTASVERCWIHNNEFYGPDISNPAEGDKGEGDGSCDFKRGQYFTCSYNYFEGCHKTNLVGSSDTSLQYNMTYHHNYWKLCKARSPLARHANIHMYNNLFEGQTDFAMNTRASAYIFSEYNMFYMCKNPHRVDDGAIKSYNDSFSSYIGEMGGTIVTSRTQTVANSCKFAARNIDYSKFDTDATQSYIPGGDYIIQEDVTEARKTIAAMTGVTKRNSKDADDVAMSEISLIPSNVTPVSVSVPSTVNPGKIQKTVYAFTLTSAATVTIAYDSDAETATGVLTNEAGVSMLMASGSVVLMPGKYMVQPVNFQPGDSKAVTVGQFKAITITSISFAAYDSAELNNKLISDYNTKAGLINIENIAYDNASYQLIANAKNAYALLSADLQSQVTVPYSTVTAAFDKYVDLGEAEVEGKIAAIGAVDASSGSKITAARSAYQALIKVAPDATVSNYATLTAAEAAYVAYEVEGVNLAITNLAEASSVTTEADIRALLEQYEAVKTMYEDLDEDQKASVTNYAKVTSGITTLNAALAPYEVKELIADLPAATAVTRADAAQITAARKAYDALTTEQKAIVGDITKLTEAEAALAELSAGTTVIFLVKLSENSGVSLPDWVTIANDNYKDNKTTFEYDGTQYKAPLKMESKTSITINLAAKSKITIVGSSAAGKVKIDGADTSISGAITLEAGEHTITKKDSINLYYIIVEDAA